MCGICGVVAYDASLEQTRVLVSRMNEKIAHRGPDGQGQALHADATLAMRRLAIVDVEHGGQPMANDDASIVLVYNGEIYNALELRRRLEKRGIRFRTRSDTEVILRLYEVSPDDVERQLVGMWAFAIHDRRRRRVLLSRDRFGIKPLFIADTGSAVAFASELRCFDRTVEPFSRLFAINHRAAHAMVSWGYVPETATIYEGVERLPPGSRLTIDLAGGSRKRERYWRLEPSNDAASVRSLDEACEGVESLLRRAVKEHLESDVPIATFLSGGIDSSLVTQYAFEQSSHPIKAYSIGFAEARFDESLFAATTAERIGVPLVVKQLDEKTVRASLADAVLAYDEPFGDSSSLATYLLSSHVASSYKVALGGDGGDEVFAGYKKHRVVGLRRSLASVPRARDAIGRALARVPAYHDRTRGWTEILRTIERLSRGLEGDDAHAYVNLTQVASLARTAPLMRAVGDVEWERSARQRFEAASGTALQRTLAADLGGPLCNDMLVKVDRASMACRLEARVPFLDHRLVEYGVGLPAAYTLGGIAERSPGKLVLRALHERRFGAALARRKKQGFGVPVEKWLRGPFDRACARVFEYGRVESFGLLSTSELSDGGFRRWIAVAPMLVWNAFTLALWCEANLGRGPSAVAELLSEG